MERTNRAQGLFNKFGLTCNVLPYFGYLDQSYKLMSQLNRNSRARWEDFEEEFCLNLLDERRRTLNLCFHYSDKVSKWKTKDIIKFLKKYPKLHKIFGFPIFNIGSSDEMEILIDYLETINNKFVRFSQLNFDKTTLEALFIERYTSILESNGLEEQSQELHKYVSTKGKVINPAKMEGLSNAEFKVPISTICLLLTENPDIREEQKENLSMSLQKSVRSLHINCMKPMDDYLAVCSNVIKAVEWFENIETLKFSVSKAPTSCLVNVLLNFYKKIGEYIEIKVSGMKGNKKIVARNGLIMMLYVDPNSNSSKKVLMRAKHLEYEVKIPSLVVGVDPQWLQVQDIGSIKIQLYNRKKREEEELKDIYETKLIPTFENSHFLIRKRDITELSLRSPHSFCLVNQFNPCALVNFDISEIKSHEVDYFNENYIEGTPIALICKNPEYTTYCETLKSGMTKNIRSLNLELFEKDKTKEVVVVQELHKMIKDNDTLEELCIKLHDQTNIVSVIDSCDEKRKIEHITIICTSDLSPEVKKHIKMYKRKHIFKTIRVYITLPETRQESKRGLIF